MSGVFVSYRREDSAGYAGRLYDRLAERWTTERVFMDVDNIQPGEDWAKRIEESVTSCDCLVAVIGRQWLSSTKDDGRQRLDDPRDFVRLEISTALSRKIPVIPVLVGGARMPNADQLPADLASLPRHQALDISDTRFSHDVAALIEALEHCLGAKADDRDSLVWDIKDFPSELVGTQLATFEVHFGSELVGALMSVVTVATNLEVACLSQPGRHQPFRFDFAVEESRCQKFQIWARAAAEKSSRERVCLLCEGNTRDGRITATRDEFAIDLPYAPAWLDYLPKPLRKIRRLLLVVSVLVPFAWKLLPSEFKQQGAFFAQRTLISVGLHEPLPFKAKNVDLLKADVEWAKPFEWKLDSELRSLSAKGSGIALAHYPPNRGTWERPEDLKNLEVKFEVPVGRDLDRIFWVLRAQSDKNYYLFCLDLPDQARKQFNVRAEAWRGGTFQKNLVVESTPQWSDIGELCVVSQGRLFFDARATGNRFTIQVKLNIDENSPGARCLAGVAGAPLEWVLVDHDSNYAWGSIGFAIPSTTQRPDLKIEQARILEAN